MLEFSMSLIIFFPTPTFAYYAMWLVTFLGENIQGRKPLRISCVKFNQAEKEKIERYFIYSENQIISIYSWYFTNAFPSSG
jgi:hypothetical protein